MSDSRSFDDLSLKIQPNSPADWPPDLLAQFGGDLKRLCAEAGCAGTYRVQGTGGRKPGSDKTCGITIGDALLNGVQILAQYGEDESREVWILHRQPHENTDRLRQRLIDARATLLEGPQEPPAVPEQAESGEAPEASLGDYQTKFAEFEQQAQGVKALESELAEIDAEIAPLKEWLDERQARRTEIAGRLEEARKAEAKVKAMKKLLDE